MRKKILIIDDDIMTLRKLKRSLEDYYEIQLENAGSRFAEHLTEYHANLILLDIEMPVMSGPEVFDALLKAGYPSVPVLFLSDLPNPPSIRDAMGRGAKGYLLKSASKEEIVSRIKQIFTEQAGFDDKTHILVLGNDVTTMRIAKLDLEDGGYRVTCVFSVMEALDIMRQKNVDALLITEPIVNVSEQEIYETICKKLSVRSFPAVYALDPVYKESLLDKVGKAVGR